VYVVHYLRAVIRLVGITRSNVEGYPLLSDRNMNANFVKPYTTFVVYCVVPKGLTL